MTTRERLRCFKKIYEQLESKGYVIWYNNQKGVKEFGLPTTEGGVIPQTIGYIDNNTFEVIYYKKEVKDNDE